MSIAFEKKWRVRAPVGNVLVPKEIMSEKELREFVLSIIPEPDESDENDEAWREKAQKDPIESVVEWLRQVGYSVEQIEVKA